MNSEDMSQLIYARVAETFAARIQDIFGSEETLKAAHAEVFPALPFDRTERWNHILRRTLNDVWKKHGPQVISSLTDYDTRQILRALQGKVDFNLLTQVMLNLQDWSLVQYRQGDAEALLNQLRQKWEGVTPSPFDAKPKMFKTAATDQERSYNRDLSTIRALKIVTSQTNDKSFRVSPKGSTPALTDSQNLSMLGVGGDQFLTVPVGCQAFYFTWEQAPTVVEPVDGKFRHPFIPYDFESKSGGDILNAALFARETTAMIYGSLDPEKNSAVLPRMTSVLLVTNEEPETVREVHGRIKNLVPGGMELHEGARKESGAA